MSWLYERFVLPSAISGPIECKRLLGRWEINVHGCYESSSYMTDLWRDAVARIPKNTSIKRILMLGLAAGGSIPLLHRRFPGCHITAVEWDPVMIDIFHRIKLVKPSQKPEIILGDAAETVPKLHGTYDLVLYDLFLGHSVPEQVTTANFFKSLEPRTHRDSFVIINAGPRAALPSTWKSFLHSLFFLIRPLRLEAPQPKILQNANTYFIRWSSFRFRANLVAMYRHFGAGVMGDPLPEGYQSFRGSQAYLEREVAIHPSLKLMGNEQCPGLQRRLGPVGIEKYYGDTEPSVQPTGFPRLIVWQPLRRLDKPPGWDRSPFQINAYITGFVDLHASQDLTDSWSPHALRHLKRWEAVKELWTSQPLTLSAFMEWYMKTGKGRAIKRLNHHFITSKAKAHGTRLKLVGYRRNASMEFEAGFAALDIPEISQSIHIASFILDSAKDTHVGTGMVYDWFQRLRHEHIRFADFDLFRGPGDPKSWEGFSRFKAQFGTYFVRYPNPLIRWIKK